MELSPARTERHVRNHGRLKDTSLPLYTIGLTCSQRHIMRSRVHPKIEDKSTIDCPPRLLDIRCSFPVVRCTVTPHCYDTAYQFWQYLVESQKKRKRHLPRLLQCITPPFPSPLSFDESLDLLRKQPIPVAGNGTDRLSPGGDPIPMLCF